MAKSKMKASVAISTAQPPLRQAGATVGYETELWRMADALRGSMDAAEYKHVVPGLIFLWVRDNSISRPRRLEPDQIQKTPPGHELVGRPGDLPASLMQKRAVCTC